MTFLSGFSRASVVIVGPLLVTLAATLVVTRHRPPVAPDQPLEALPRSTQPIPYEEARAIVDRLRDGLPASVRALAGAGGERRWRAWLSEHDRSIRGRLDRGNEDSLYYFWLYGTSFTTQPRATPDELAARGDSASIDLLESRLNDLMTRLTTPLGDDRLAFARSVVEHRGIDLSSAESREATRVLFVQIRNRVMAENRHLSQLVAAGSRLNDPARQDVVFGTMLRDRGLSSDTSLDANFSVTEALRTVKTKGVMAPRALGRIAIVGPGLDFTDKAEGFDFYAEQSLQPFAIIDAVRELELTSPAGLDVVTLDLNPRINRHLERARERAAGGAPYVLHLPFDRSDYRDVRPELVRYWQTLGSRIGDPVTTVAPPPAIGPVELRAVNVRPDVVRSVVPLDLNVVTERLDGKGGGPFDLIIATNVLVYYDVFDQALALANISAMLRPGGLFLTNTAVAPPPGLRLLADASGPVALDDDQFDTMLWFQRVE